MSKKNKKKSAKNKVSKKKNTSPKKAVKKTAKKAPAKKKAPVKKKAKPAPRKKTVKKAVKKVVKKAAKKVIKKAAKKIAKPLVKKIAAPAKPLKKVIAAKPEKLPAPQVKKIAPPKAEAAKPAVKKVVKAEPIAIPKKSVIIDIKTGPEPAGKFELEFVVHASAQILFEFLTTPSGLSEWFCDDVNIRNGVYSFKWEENEQNARVVKLVEEKQVRFQWLDKTDNSYFEFRIERDDLTNDISLIISDFAETQEERASSSLLWQSQIDKLLHVLGAYF